MMKTVTHTERRIPGNRRASTPVLIALLALSAGLTGCTAVTNPIADGIPVRHLPQELLAPSKTGMQTVPLNMLRQPQPDAYRLDSGDVLGVFVDGFIGDRNVPLPVQVAPLVQVRDQYRLPPSAGYPVPISEDGKIALPSVGKLSVRGLTVAEARDAIRDAYIKAELIRKDNDRIIVTMLHPRQTQVMVFRQEAQHFQAGQDGPVPIAKRNTGQVVELPAYQNDVLNALARSGGLPELDAFNEVIIYRDGMFNPAVKPGKNGDPPPYRIADCVRIPLRLPCGVPLPFGRDDILLRPGDVVFLEARDEQVFFTAGLLPPGKHVLPRDHDLDVLQAITQVRGPLYNGAFGGSNLAGNLVQPGLGNPSPSLLLVLRQVPGRGQVPIAVDLREAMRHPEERLVLAPGDVLVLQEKPGEAFARYFTQTFLNFNILLEVFRSSTGVGLVDVSAPDRIPGRLGFFTIPPP
jgi:protein involved in polysaccharide export with SLBB domain